MAGSAAARGRGRHGGYTLLELLVVLAIVGVLLGLGAGVMASAGKGLALHAAANLALSSVRLARSRAMATHAPCWLILDPAENTVKTLSRETIGLWHFEDAKEEVTTGARGRNGTLHDARLVPGRTGLGLLLEGDGWVECAGVARDAAEQGIALEAWCLAGEPADMTILAKPGEYALSMTAAGTLRFEVGGKRLESTSPAPLRRWFFVEAIWDGAAASLYVNEESVGEAELAVAPPVGDAPLTIGARKHGFRGVLDEVKVAVLAWSEPRTLPPEVKIDGDAPVALRFDSLGRLAARASFTLRSADEALPFVVGVHGEVE